jgi:hypothetical protein
VGATESPGYVARQMGHSSVATTLSFYAHWFPKDDRRMAPLRHHSQESDPELLDSAEAVGSVGDRAT